MSRNPLEEYRRVQRALRRDFDAFTAKHCATCPTPCCMKPTRVAPADILLAEGTGWKDRVRETLDADPVERAAGMGMDALSGRYEDVPPAPCDYLGEKGCAFPPDLRPFGCTTYLCPLMHRNLDRRTLARLKRLVRELEYWHDRLMTAIHVRR